jgi:multiple sugar transport system substrate-binding protein
MANLLDPLIADKTVPVASVFAATFPKQYGSKILMEIGPTWYGDYVFNSSTSVAAAADTYAAAAPLSWTAGQTPVTGDIGGGLWFVSSHSKQEKLAASVATWLGTAPGSQLIAPTYPAYAPDDTPWLTTQLKGGFFANPATGPDSLGSVFAAAANEVWSGWSPLRVDTDNVWSASVTPGLTTGSTLASLLSTYGTAISNAAQVDGYTVKK